jgi:hypothetical protein
VLTWAGKDWLAQVGRRGRALDVVRAHIAAEVDTRTDVIMSTVSADPWFPLPERLPAGLALTVIEGTADVTGYYSERSDGYVARLEPAPAICRRLVRVQRKRGDVTLDRRDRHRPSRRRGIHRAIGGVVPHSGGWHPG